MFRKNQEPSEPHPWIECQKAWETFARIQKDRFRFRLKEMISSDIDIQTLERWRTQFLVGYCPGHEWFRVIISDNAIGEENRIGYVNFDIEHSGVPIQNTIEIDIITETFQKLCSAFSECGERDTLRGTIQLSEAMTLRNDEYMGLSNTDVDIARFNVQRTTRLGEP